MNAYGRYCRPKLVELLEAMSLDAVYDRAEGDRMWRRVGAGQVEVLDLLGGFGANLFGHYHPELVAEEQRLTRERVPLLAQGSCRQGAAALAEALCRRLGDYIVIHTNSGAEAVEAAIKHVYLERGRSLFWAVKGAFHGKTLGAIQLTQNYREPFAPWSPEVRFLDPHDPASWAPAASESGRVAAAFIEPVLGEGGIQPLDRAFVAWLRDTCRERQIPLVVDEIQTGLGRTGTFLASEWLGIDPDYICLSKALGGGLGKIGVVLIRRSRFVAEFATKHTSTFAEDDRTSFLAVKALEILARDDLPGRCAARGEYLLERLRELHRQFPDQIREVRGRGLMIGIELQDLSESPSNSLRMISQQEYLGYLAAAYLLNVHNIRIGPALSQPFTLRIEPSAYIACADLDRFVEAFGQFCAGLKALDLVHLTGYQVGLKAGPVRPRAVPKLAPREAPQSACRVAFIGHLLMPEHALLWDPCLEGFSAEELEAYMAKPCRVLGPTVFEQLNIRSATGATVHFSYLGLDLTPRQIMQAIRERDVGWIMDKIEDALVLAREAGATMVGLGAYTSIVSGNGLRLKTPGVFLTSGNSLTVGMGLSALREAAAEEGISVAGSRLGVVGATGNIAATYAAMMAPDVAALMLLVRDPNSPRLRGLVKDLKSLAPGTTIEVSSEMDSLRTCELIVAASNATEPVVFPRHLSAGRVVICDISLPADVAPEVARERPDVRVIRGGVVRLPGNEDLRIAGLPLEAGHVYACMAETMLMGLEGFTRHGSYGPVTPEGVKETLALAQRHHFALGSLLTGHAY